MSRQDRLIIVLTIALGAALLVLLVGGTFVIKNLSDQNNKLSSEQSVQNGIISSNTSLISDVQNLAIRTDQIAKIANRRSVKTVLKLEGKPVPGLPGANGKSGTPGVVGAIGGKGPAGPTGPQGLTGMVGLPGANANDTQIQNAISNYCLSRKNCAGSTGQTGPVGPAGEKGETGAAGPTGGVGAQGPPPATFMFGCSISSFTSSFTVTETLQPDGSYTPNCVTTP